MPISKSKLNIYKEDFINRVNSLSEIDFNDMGKVNNLIHIYDEISALLIDLKGVPDSVRKFLINESEHKNIELPSEYEYLKSIQKLYDTVKISAKKEIEKALNTNDYKTIISIIGNALKVSINNIELISYIEDKFKECGLDDDLTELYKVEFVYTLNPICFEKTGDIYYTKQDYNSAVDSYLSCAEISGDYLQIYEKLADVFEKINDDKSKLACIEQIKRIKDGL